MIIRNIEDLRGTQLDVNWGYGSSIRLLVASDGMGFTITDTLVLPNSRYELKYKRHIEACYILEGTGKLYFNDEVCRLEPGVLYGLNEHDTHVVESETAIRMICVFQPALAGEETHTFSAHGPSGY